MLDKLVVHFKNIIFFKIVIYSTAAILLFTIMPIFQEDLEKAQNRHEHAQSFLSSATLKLESIIDFEDKIQDMNKEYRKLMLNSGGLTCVDRNIIINDMRNIEKKYNLFEPINIYISRIFNVAKSPNTSGHIKVNHYELSLKFKADSYFKLLSVSQAIYKTLPKGAVVNVTRIYPVNSLTPELIDRLNTQNYPGFIGVDMIIHLKEIVYEQ